MIVNEGKILVEEDNKIDHFYVVIDGKLGKLKGKDNLITKEDLYENLGVAANKHIRDIAKGLKSGKEAKAFSFASHIRRMSFSMPKR